MFFFTRSSFDPVSPRENPCFSDQTKNLGWPPLVDRSRDSTQSRDRASQSCGARLTRRPVNGSSTNRRNFAERIRAMIWPRPASLKSASRRRLPTAWSQRGTPRPDCRSILAWRGRGARRHSGGPGPIAKLLGRGISSTRLASAVQRCTIDHAQGRGIPSGGRAKRHARLGGQPG
jgi:hypothetical protein